MDVHVLLHAAGHAVSDSLKMFPFLLLAFLVVESLEHQSSAWMQKAVSRGDTVGPVIGALLGCITQCGFSVVAANLYSGGVVSLGTLLAVFLSTSDEAVLILMGNPGSGGDILKLIICKALIGVAAGYAVDIMLHFRRNRKRRTPHDLCDGVNCGCDSHHGIFRPALYHAGKLTIYLLIFNFALGLMIELIGEDTLAKVLLNGHLLQPFLTAAIGLIPNCASSILITELYLSAGIGFGSAVAGLCSGAGVGLAVLFRVHKDKKKSLQIMGILYLIAAVSGMFVQLILG